MFTVKDYRKLVSVACSTTVLEILGRRLQKQAKSYIGQLGLTRKHPIIMGTRNSMGRHVLRVFEAGERGSLFSVLEGQFSPSQRRGS